MDAADLALPSYGVLAERCLEDPGWPPDVAPKPRSLAALFSKFDRGIELEWLADRERVQHVLSAVLRCPLARVREPLDRFLQLGDERIARYRFEDAPQIRPLDLADERLPPGIPSLLQMPRRWERVQFRATPAHGARLLGAWLEARGLAHVVRARSAEEAAARLDDSGPNYVELSVAPPSPMAWPRSSLCVVCSAAPLDGFRVVDAPPIMAYLDELVVWLGDRLPPDGRFDQEAALSWLRDNPEVAVDFESVVGLLGMIDALGMKEVRGRSTRALAKTFIAHRMAPARVAEPEANWTQRHAMELMVALAKACAVDSALPFEASRTQEEWFELVPPEFQRSVDVEWATASLAQAGSLSSRELSLALERVPPGAFRALQGLENARLLRRDDQGLLRAGPSWLARSARLRAEREMVASSPFEWGDALLSPHAATGVRDALFQRIHDGDFDPIEKVLDLEEATNPAYVAAVEAVTEVVGVSLLNGAELSTEPLALLFELQRNLAVHLPDGELRPRLGRAGSGDGAWLLAMCVLGDRVAADRSNPMTGSLAVSALTREQLDDVQHFLEGVEVAVRASGYVLMAGLFASDTKRAEHPMLLPTALLEKVTWSRLKRLATLSEGVGLLYEIVQRRGDAGETTSSWPQLAGSLWRCWHDAGLPETTLFHPLAGGAERLWPHLPHRVLEALLVRSHPVLSHPPFHWFSRTHLELYANHVVRPHADLFRLVDRAMLHEALGAALREPRAIGLRILWERFPDALTARAATAFESGEEPLLPALLASTPDAVRRELIAALYDQVARHGVGASGTATLLPWLLSCCRHRVEGWREAFALLDEIQRRRGRAERARGLR